MLIPSALKSLRRELPVATRVNSNPQLRRAAIYDAVLDQFGVEENPRYLPADGYTYCNVFSWDCMNAMNAILPHWVKPNGDPALPGVHVEAREQLANDVADWLEQHGGRYFWQEGTAEEAQQWANEGRPCVAVWKRPNGHGHIAPVRPGDVRPVLLEGPLIANAGSFNHNRVRVAKVFVSAWKVQKVKFWCAP
jgi:hypothetical protein